MNYRMKYGILRGVTDTGSFIFTATVPDDLDTVGDTWFYTHIKMPGLIGTMHGKLEGVVTYLLMEFPDISYIEYLDSNGKYHTSWPSRALPNHVATLVAKELEK